MTATVTSVMLKCNTLVLVVLAAIASKIYTINVYLSCSKVFKSRLSQLLRLVYLTARVTSMMLKCNVVVLVVPAATASTTCTINVCLTCSPVFKSRKSQLLRLV